MDDRSLVLGSDPRCRGPHSEYFAISLLWFLQIPFWQSASSGNYSQAILRTGLISVTIDRIDTTGILIKNVKFVVKRIEHFPGFVICQKRLRKKVIVMPIL
tara:strand:+ start:8995 stop:9297 length:303 start_codon:yes stop_codon:yes gene_type:complete